MTRIAFTADLHADDQGSRIYPATGLNARFLDHLRTTRWIAEEAIREGCDALVVAGDFTEDKRSRAWRIAKIRRELSAFPGPMIALRGNHDEEVQGDSTVTLLDGWRPDWHGVARPAVHWVGRTAIACIPYLEKRWLRAQPGYETVPDAQIHEAIAREFLAIARGLFVEASDRRPRAEGIVLTCHQTLFGAEMNDSQRALFGDKQVLIPTDELAAIGFDGIVAGHIHRHQVLRDDPPVLYAGSIEPVDFGEEGEVKGFVVADVGRGRFDWQFVPTPARRFVTLTDPTVGQAMAEVRDAIVRVRCTTPIEDVAGLRRWLEELGAFEVRSISAPVEAAPVPDSPYSETLTPDQFLELRFVGDPDREALLAHGRAILEEIGAAA